MKKLFFITLFSIGLTTTMQAQCVDESDLTNMTTGFTGFLDTFTFSNDTIDLGVDIPSLSINIDVIFDDIIYVNTNNGQDYYEATVYYNGYYYHFEVYANSSDDTVISFDICRTTSAPY